MLASEEELVVKEMEVEKKHPKLLVENVLVRVEDFNFPIDSLTFGMEEDRQVSSKEIPSIATSQVWINSEHGEERARASAMAATSAAAPVGVARAKVVG